MLEVGKRYRQKNGGEVEVIAVRGDVAWATGVWHDGLSGAAYRYNAATGATICLAGDAGKYDLVLPREVSEAVADAFCDVFFDTPPYAPTPRITYALSAALDAYDAERRAAE